MRRTHAMRACALVMVLMFLCLSAWEGFGHCQSSAGHQHEHALAPGATAGPAFARSEGATGHDESDCPVCAAIQSSVGYLARPVTIDCRISHLYAIPTNSTTAKSPLKNSSSSRAPPAA